MRGEAQTHKEDQIRKLQKRIGIGGSLVRSMHSVATTRVRRSGQPTGGTTKTAEDGGVDIGSSPVSSD
jgi:hypothetical protein